MSQFMNEGVTALGFVGGQKIVPYPDHRQPPTVYDPNLRQRFGKIIVGLDFE